ncbi:MAG: glycogen/starch/alpha-glucan phosphorylase [Gammaproteobacteria bacterium]
MKHRSMATNEEREPTRTGLSVEALKRAIIDNLFYMQGRFRDVATLNDDYMAVAYTVRDRILARWIKTAQTYKHDRSRTVCYLSAEFLLGPHLGNNLVNLGILDEGRQALAELGLDFEAILEQEEEPGLGNGGLGRLAACYLDSLATLQIPAIGYGIRYEYGIFEQQLRDGWQVELSDVWLRNGNPWELPRPKLRFPVEFGGHTEHYRDEGGQHHVKWVPELEINGVAYDTPILGYGVNNANLLRLWKSEAPESFDFQAFNVGDYYGAVDAKVVAENISKVLYPNDEPEAGKVLRLKQQYFFVSCSLQDMIRLHLQAADNLDGFHEKFAAQLNDTHPAIAIAELMRLFVDRHGLSWEQAWDITRQTFAFTNHTLLPEALETWPVELFQHLLPRHLEIIYEINARFLDQVRTRFLGDNERLRRLSLIDEAGGRSVRMAHLACVGSRAINGVSALHTELLESRVLRDFYDLWPEKFSNKTNGVSPRRFLVLSNPRLSALLKDTIGERWIRDLGHLQALEHYADDGEFHARWRAVKTATKSDLANWVNKRLGISLDPTSLFDVQVKRIHEYKRQHLNVLHIITLYQRFKQGPSFDIAPRTFIFGGKAAPSYHMAKLIIKLINAVGEVINRDPQVNGYLRVVFIPDFSVKRGQRIYPAADLSEQIATAGLEASGTGNMKFAMNGALTIGTLDGANIEIREEVGEENFFLFGLTADQVQQQKSEGYRPWDIYNANPELKAALDLIDSGLFSHGDTELFRPLTNALLHHDPYLVLADYRSYVDCQDQIDQAYRDPDRWNRMSILNVARIGKFSSDRAVRDYCDTIWRVKPLPIDLE